MSFGWAYINCSGSGGDHVGGPQSSIQFIKQPYHSTGSANLVFYTSSYGGYGPNTMRLKGTLHVSGTISASHYHIENVTEIDASGSTYFGNTNDDVHIRTGSLEVVKADGSYILQSLTATRQTKIKALRLGLDIVDTAIYTASQDTCILGIAQPNDVYIQLLTASVAGSGSVVVIKDQIAPNRGPYSIYLSASSSDRIDGSTIYEMTGSMLAINLYSDGRNWYVF